LRERAERDLGVLARLVKANSKIAP